MGFNMAPTYSNIFMASLEEDVIYVTHQFEHISAWRRYIDDIFTIWIGTQEELEIFFSFLNNMDDDIKFTVSFSHTTLQFLNTLV